MYLRVFVSLYLRRNVPLLKNQMGEIRILYHNVNELVSLLLLVVVKYHILTDTTILFFEMALYYVNLHFDNTISH